jgi:hypothetical protein
MGSDGEPAGSLHVFTWPGGKQIAALVCSVLLLIAIAIVPWLTPLFEDFPTWVGLLWTAACALILVGLAAQGLRVWSRVR